VAITLASGGAFHMDSLDIANVISPARPLVERELAAEVIERSPSEGSGMVWEDGLLVYGAGTALPAGFIDNALRRFREERSQHLLGRDN
jgi:hypothetical protein